MFTEDAETALLDLKEMLSGGFSKCGDKVMLLCAERFGGKTLSRE